jgi:hypothetical protein
MEADEQEILLRGSALEKVHSFKYLGCTLKANGESTHGNRIGTPIALKAE